MNTNIKKTFIQIFSAIVLLAFAPLSSFAQLFSGFKGAGSSGGLIDSTGIADLGVASSDISNGAISTAKIANSAVTTAKVSQTLKTDTKSFAIADTGIVISTNDTFGLWKVPFALTVTEIAGFTDVGTVTFNIEQRAETTPNTAGTDILTSDLVADNDQQESASFNDATVPADTWLYFAPSAAASNPKKLTVAIKFTID